MSQPNTDHDDGSTVISSAPEKHTSQRDKQEAKRDSSDLVPQLSIKNSVPENQIVDAEAKDECKDDTVYERKREKKHSSSSSSNFSFEDKLAFGGDESQADLKNGNNSSFQAEEKGSSISRREAKADSTSRSPGVNERRKSFSFPSPREINKKRSSSEPGSGSDSDNADVDDFISENAGLKSFNYARRSTIKEPSLDLDDYEVSFNEKELHQPRKVSLTHDFAPNASTRKSSATTEGSDDGDIYSDLRLKDFKPRARSTTPTDNKSNSNLSSDDKKTSFKRPHDSIGISMGNFQLESMRDLRGRDGSASMEEAEGTGGNDDWESEQPVKRARAARGGYSSSMLTGKDYF